MQLHNNLVAHMASSVNVISIRESSEQIKNLFVFDEAGTLQMCCVRCRKSGAQAVQMNILLYANALYNNLN